MMYINYELHFGIGHAPNIGLLLTITLLMILVFFELSQPLANDVHFHALQSLRTRFKNLALILLIIFAGMVFVRLYVHK